MPAGEVIGLRVHGSGDVLQVIGWSGGDREDGAHTGSTQRTAERCRQPAIGCDASRRGPLGLRRGELCGIHWDDVEAELGILHVRRQIVRTKDSITETTPKTRRSIRDVELTEAALNAINQQPKRSV